MFCWHFRWTVTEAAQAGREEIIQQLAAQVQQVRVIRAHQHRAGQGGKALRDRLGGRRLARGRGPAADHLQAITQESQIRFGRRIDGFNSHFVFTDSSATF